MTTYTVTAKKWKRGWELHVEDVGVTQSKRLNDDAEAMVRDLIARRQGVPERSFELEWRYDFEGEHALGEEARAARIATREAAAAQTNAAARVRGVAVRLKAQGVTGREAAKILGVSAQRISQLNKR